MYVHPQEVDYSIESLFELIDASGLDFVGFSNPHYWSLERLLGKAPDLMERANHLSDRQRYRLIELLDPDISHYELFLARPPLPHADWSSSDEALLSAIPELNPCMDGWPSQTLFNYDYQIVNLSSDEYQFLQACDQSDHRTVADILANVPLALNGVRSLLDRHLIMMTPS
jgi:hypothetical protein